MVNRQKNHKPKDTQEMLSRYQRAQAFEHEMRVPSMVLNAQIFPHWVGDSDCFWYIRMRRQGNGTAADIVKEYRLVNADSGRNTEAFDHALLAETLSQASGRDVRSQDLPISQLKLSLSPCRVEFVAFNRHWAFDASTASCQEIAITQGRVSPDGKKTVFLRNYNVWLRDLASGEEQALTRDGELHYAYGVQPERVDLVADFGASLWASSGLPEVLWSPDSKQLLTVQVDERRVLPIPVTQYVPTDGSVRPQFRQRQYALPGDQNIVEYRVLAINIDSGQICDADYPAIQDALVISSLFGGNRAWWSKDSSEAYFIDMARGQQQALVVAFNTRTGASRTVFKETSDTYIDLNFDFECPALLQALPASHELIWFSERSGWGHLYLYDLISGALKHPITEGDYLVREILFVDTEKRELLIQVAGRDKERDPYYREICRVNMDTGAMLTLASSDHDYLVCKPGHTRVASAVSRGLAAPACSGVSPSGRFIVVSRSRADLATSTELIDSEGRFVLNVETADVSGLPEGWQWPEPVKLLAADGKTDVYGLVLRPSDFSSDKQYPVLNYAHTNSFYAFVPKTLDPFPYMSLQALAELGFITVVIDGRGSCYRSKAFHDEAYGSTHTGSNLEDHIAGICQLAERYPYMDLDRVGITDTSGSNAPLYGLLAYPDFYKVGAGYSMWDVRLLPQSETYQGLLPEADYEQSVLGNLAGNLKGKLLLMHGLMDPYFYSAAAFQLVEALVKENKDLFQETG